jgi:hypothetical protein
METVFKLIQPKKYISENIKLDFFNDSNLKTCIQQRISPNTEDEFVKHLNNIRGDKQTGTSFSEVTLWALAYFYSEIFKDQIKDNFYTLNHVKGFLDGDNLTSYTAIDELDVEFHKLKNSPYFKHCWLIIQIAWFFNSGKFGGHQYIDYINHFTTTGKKLPIELYKYDKDHLEKKYTKLSNTTDSMTSSNGYSIVYKWYYYILFLICKELQLPTDNFIISYNDNREYNPLTKSPKQLRGIAPFKIIECDIKNAFPTFIDYEIGSNLRDKVYNNLVVSRRTTRVESKILFSKFCNSGQYNSQEKTIAFFKECGYTDEQSIQLVKFTHDPVKKFFSFMTRHENIAIGTFVQRNNLHRGGRLHDSIIFIDDKTKPCILTINNNCEFGYKELNRPFIKETFGYGTKRLQSAYVSSIPRDLVLITRFEGSKSEIKGIKKPFRFYTNHFEYIKASFNLNDYHNSHLDDTRSYFYSQLDKMFSTLLYLNKRHLKASELYLILIHIRVNSNYIFNVRALHNRLRKQGWNKTDVVIEVKDYDQIEMKHFTKRIDYIKELNRARKIVNTDYNYSNLFSLIQEHISNEDYSYLELDVIGKRKNNGLSFAILRKYNLLVTGRQRKQRKGVKKDPLYNSTIKSVLIKSMSLPKQQQNSFAIRSIVQYERELRAYNRFVNNREITKQLLLVVGELVDRKTDCIIERDEAIINKLKTELYETSIKIRCISEEVGAKLFDDMFLKNENLEIVPNIPEDCDFETDMEKSIFNQVEIEDAYSMGDSFFTEYLKFHKLVNSDIDYSPCLPTKTYHLPEIEF